MTWWPRSHMAVTTCSPTKNYSKAWTAAWQIQQKVPRPLGARTATDGSCTAPGHVTAHVSTMAHPGKQTVAQQAAQLSKISKDEQLRDVISHRDIGTAAHSTPEDVQDYMGMGHTVVPMHSLVCRTSQQQPQDCTNTLCRPQQTIRQPAPDMHRPDPDYDVY